MPGSDSKINYSIRPAKSVERKMMCEMLRELQIALGQADYRYIGMGAKYFADFILFHNEFGFNEMISIEAENSCCDRYEFNKPLKCIEMRYGYTSEQLPQINMEGGKPNFIWLDYDQVFCEYMLEDITILLNKMSVGSLFFISFNSTFKGKPKEKYDSFKKKVGKFTPNGLNKNDLNSNVIAITIKNIIDNVISDTISRVNIMKETQDKVKYKQLLFLSYQDGAPMLTVGGILINDRMENTLTQFNIEERHPFIISDQSQAQYNIEMPSLTYKETQAILQAMPISGSEDELESIRIPGITKDDILKFEKIYRYYPFILEARAYN